MRNDNEVFLSVRNRLYDPYLHKKVSRNRDFCDKIPIEKINEDIQASFNNVENQEWPI